MLARKAVVYMFHVVYYSTTNTAEKENTLKINIKEILLQRGIRKIVLDVWFTYYKNKIRVNMEIF